MTNPIVLAKDYPTLRRKVQETLLLGQRKIEEAKVLTYLHTGQLINEHIAAHASRAEHYGRQVVVKLGDDTDVHPSVLWRCARFAEAFKILAGRQESLPPYLNWSHYRELIKISDEETRIAFMHRASKAQWTSDVLAEKIRQEVTGLRQDKDETAQPSIAKLIARKGALYTYRLIETDPLHKKYTDGLRIDLGFKIHQQLPDAAKGLKAGQIIETVKTDDYEVVASQRKESDLFTYKAYVERVVDGDTLYVDIDLGFKSGTFQYLRLRGINAPELDTPEGKQAKTFVERQLANVPYILLTSSRSDKYDRYLADVYYGEGEKERFLNQVLLEEGLAERVG